MDIGGSKMEVVDLVSFLVYPPSGPAMMASVNTGWVSA